MPFKHLAVSTFRRAKIIIAHGHIADHALTSRVIRRDLGRFLQNILGFRELPHFFAHTGKKIVGREKLRKIFNYRATDQFSFRELIQTAQGNCQAHARPRDGRVIQHLLINRFRLIVTTQHVQDFTFKAENVVKKQILGTQQRIASG